MRSSQQQLIKKKKIPAALFKKISIVAACGYFLI
jgi:hypothetical protein